MDRLLRQAAETGAKHGYSDGWEHGYHAGICEYVLSRIVRGERVSVRNVRVLYIPQGFEAIDGGIWDALRSVAREAYLGSPKEMAELAERLRPDLVLVMNGLHVFPPDHLMQVERIRRIGVRTAIWFADDPYFTDLTASLAPHYDYVFTHERNCVSFYESIGCANTHYLPLACNLSIFRPQPVKPAYRTDICFVGQGFNSRLALIDSIAPYLAGKRVFIAGGLWDRLKHYRQLRKQIRLGWLDIAESARYYAGAKIVINMHREADSPIHNRNSLGIRAASINPRTYEIAGCGVMQLSDVRDDMPNYYTTGIDIATYASADDLLHKLDYYLNHEEERRAIAMRGLQRTHKEHTFLGRLQRMMDVIFAGELTGSNVEREEISHGSSIEGRA